MAFCGTCGAPGEDSARFCGTCGAAMAPGATSGTPGAGEALAAVAAGVGSAGRAAATAARIAANHAGRSLHEAANQHGVIGDGQVAYSPAIIQQFAAGMYRRAFWMVVIYTVIGVVIGLLLGAAISQARQATGGSGSSGPAIFCMVILGALGFWIGQQKAFWLKFSAQTALCQAQIEINTRAG